MKVGIYGGSFNPIHKGHINLALQLTKQLGLSKVIFVPTNKSPHKANDPLIDNKTRYYLCKSVCKKYETFEVSNIELKSLELNFTVNTLKKYFLKYSGSEIFLLLGSDMFMKIVFWKGFEEIIKMATLCTMPRYLDELENLLEVQKRLNVLHAKTKVFSSKIVSISSTEIKEKIKKREDFKELLTPEGYKFIIRNNLYR